MLTISKPLQIFVLLIITIKVWHTNCANLFDCLTLALVKILYKTLSLMLVKTNKKCDLRLYSFRLQVHTL